MSLSNPLKDAEAGTVVLVALLGVAAVYFLYEAGQGVKNSISAAGAGVGAAVYDAESTANNMFTGALNVMWPGIYTPSE